MKCPNEFACKEVYQVYQNKVYHEMKKQLLIMMLHARLDQIGREDIVLSSLAIYPHNRRERDGRSMAASAVLHCLRIDSSKCNTPACTMRTPLRKPFHIGNRISHVTSHISNL